jgi:putative protease
VTTATETSAANPPVTRRVPELLAPAGDFEAMRAAVANGASAVYFGLGNFNARHRATNFTLDELPATMRYLHDHNVKGFLTFNTLIFSDELQAAVDYTRAIAAAGVDAVIVQDLGLARLIHAIVPTLPIHGSTQMTLTEPRGIEFVRQFGIDRVVLARELSIPEIRQIAARTTMELEVFAHGALCVAYSGQCLTSESIGGRSANRGQCAQACRLPYDLIVDGQERDLGDKAYLLSPQDLAGYELVNDLADAGVSCLKVEGRLKSAHYVAATTQVYRRAIDAARDNERFRITPEERGDLEQTFSRGFSHGFLSGVNHQELVTARFPKSRGRRVGTVVSLTRAGVVIDVGANPRRGGRASARLNARRDSRAEARQTSPTVLKPGDGVVFDEGHPEQDEQGGRIFAVRPLPRNQLQIEFGRGEVNLRAISPGAIVWKTDDPALRKRLEHSFSRDTVANRTPMDVEVVARAGERLTIRFVDVARGESVDVTWDRPLERAEKFPLNDATLREQLGRLGDTPFELREVRVDTCGGPMVPKSVLNDLRRRGVEQLVAPRQDNKRYEVAEPDALVRLRDEAKLLSPMTPVGATLVSPAHVEPLTAGDTAVVSTDTVLSRSASLHVLARTLAQLEAVLTFDAADRPASVYCDFEDVRRYKDAVRLASAASMPIALATLRVVKPHEEGLLKQVLDCESDAVLVRNLATVSFYHEHAPHLPQIGDYSLNVANELTAMVFAHAGLARIVPSYDLSWPQLAAMLRRSDASRFEAVVHQHMPMFHMEHCVFAHTLSTGKDYRDCGRPCERHQVDLRDRVDQPHPLIPDVGCRNTVFNAQAQSAAEYVPRMRELGLRHFRVELLRERPNEVAPLLRKYADLIAGRAEPRGALRSLRVLNRLGVTAGTLDRE